MEHLRTNFTNGSPILASDKNETNAAINFLIDQAAAVPELKEALTRHQYGGIILFGANITGAEQVTRLLDQLQVNNMQSNASVHIPYLIDQIIEFFLAIQ